MKTISGKEHTSEYISINLFCNIYASLPYDSLNYFSKYVE